MFSFEILRLSLSAGSSPRNLISAELGFWPGKERRRRSEEEEKKRGGGRGGGEGPRRRKKRRWALPVFFLVKIFILHSLRWVC